MYMKIEAGRLMLLRGARMIDQGRKATKEAAAAKCFVSDNAVHIVTEALQVLGGIGYRVRLRAWLVWLGLLRGRRLVWSLWEGRIRGLCGGLGVRRILMFRRAVCL